MSHSNPRKGFLSINGVIFRNRGIGSFLLRQTIELALRDECEAVYYISSSPSASRIAEKLNLKVQNRVCLSEEDSNLFSVDSQLELCGYLVLFKPLNK